MTEEQDKELRGLLEQNGWKFYEELNGFRKESKFTIPMFSTDQSKVYDALSAGNYYELLQLITADRKRVALEARIGTLNKLKNTRPNAETDDATADYLRGYREMEAKVGFELNRLRKQRKLV